MFLKHKNTKFKHWKITFLNTQLSIYQTLNEPFKNPVLYVGKQSALNTF